MVPRRDREEEAWPGPALGHSPAPVPILPTLRYRSYQEDGRWTSEYGKPRDERSARGMGQDLLAVVQKIYNTSQAHTGNISLANFRKVVAEEVKVAVNGTQEKRSWATVASQGSNHTQTQATAPAKIVPSRLSKEFLVKGKGMPADLARRTPQEIIQAINQASMKKGAVAARKLPSGDTVVTFQGTMTGDWHSTNNQWIKDAFGQQAEETVFLYLASTWTECPAHIISVWADPGRDF